MIKLQSQACFTPTGFLTLYKECSCFTVIIDFLNLYIDFAFLSSGLSLFHSPIQYIKIVFLKVFARDGIALNFPADIDH